MNPPRRRAQRQRLPCTPRLFRRRPHHHLLAAAVNGRIQPGAIPQLLDREDGGRNPAGGIRDQVLGRIPTVTRWPRAGGVASATSTIACFPATAMAVRRASLPCTSPARKFMVGAPRKPATNKLSGSW